MPDITAAHALAYHVLAPGLLARHGHGSTNAIANVWHVAHGSQGQGPRILVLAIAALIFGVLMTAVTNRKKAS